MEGGLTWNFNSSCPRTMMSENFLLLCENDEGEKAMAALDWLHHVNMLTSNLSLHLQDLNLRNKFEFLGLSLRHRDGYSAGLYVLIQVRAEAYESYERGWREG